MPTGSMILRRPHRRTSITDMSPKTSPYGLVPLASLGDLLDVPTPMCDAVIDLFSIANGVDYRNKGLTLEKLGFGGLGIETIRELVGGSATAQSTS